MPVLHHNCSNPWPQSFHHCIIFFIGDIFIVATITNSSLFIQLLKDIICNCGVFPFDNFLYIGNILEYGSVVRFGIFIFLPHSLRFRLVHHVKFFDIRSTCVEWTYYEYFLPKFRGTACKTNSCVTSEELIQNMGAISDSLAICSEHKTLNISK